MVRPSPLALLLTFALAACTASAGADHRGTSERPADYVRVVDGDTLDVRGERIRISNIDTPETGERAQCWAEASLGEAATRDMERQVQFARSLEILREGQDRYGRTLARITIDGEDLGERMVTAGLAARWTGRQWDWCAPIDPTDPAGPRTQAMRVEQGARDALAARDAWAVKAREAAN